MTFKSWLSWVLLLLVMGCASVQGPTGGPKDTQGPKLVAISPQPGTTNFDKQTVTFVFDEVLNPTPDLSKDVFISPLPSEVPTIYVRGRVLKITFNKPLAPNTTYNITLGQGIKDNTEKNPLAKPVSLALSTGSVIDTGRVVGQVVDAFTLKSVKGFTALLFSKDSIEGQAFRHKKPRYAIPADDDGYFELTNLASGEYRILAIKDDDRSFSLTGLKEQVALADTDLVVISDKVASKGLRAFMPDSIPPKLVSIRWVNGNVLRLTFNEPLRSGLVKHGLGQAVRLSANDRDPTHKARYYYHLNKKPTDTTFITINTPTDTLHNVGQDTVVKLPPPPTGITSGFRITRLPTPFERRSIKLFINNYLAEQDTGIYLKDTSNKKRLLSIQREGFYHTVLLPEGLDTTLTYTLFVDSLAKTATGQQNDTVYKFSFRPPTLDNLTTVTFQIESKRQNAVFNLFSGALKSSITLTQPAITLKHMPPGSYNLMVFEDLDGDGQYTSGQLNPRRLPEPVYYYPQTITLKPNWEQVIKIQYPE